MELQIDEHHSCARVILKDVVYPVPQPPNQFNANLIDDETELEAHGPKVKIGILYLGFYEIFSILSDLAYYPKLSNSTRFGNDLTADLISNNAFMGFASTICTIKMYSPYLAPDFINQLYIDINNDFIANKLIFDVYSAYAVDIAYIIAEAANNFLNPTTQDIIDGILNAALNYNGVSGDCTLDTTADRTWANFDIWGYKCDPNPDPHKYADYKKTDAGYQFTWYP